VPDFPAPAAQRLSDLDVVEALEVAHWALVIGQSPCLTVMLR
jgi:hypothetical protein